MTPALTNDAFSGLDTTTDADIRSHVAAVYHHLGAPLRANKVQVFSIMTDYVEFAHASAPYLVLNELDTSHLEARFRHAKIPFGMLYVEASGASALFIGDELDPILYVKVTQH